MLVTADSTGRTGVRARPPVAAARRSARTGVRVAECSIDRAAVARSSNDGRPDLRTRARELHHRLRGHGRTLAVGAVSRDGSMIAVGGNDGGWGVQAALDGRLMARSGADNDPVGDSEPCSVDRPVSPRGARDGSTCGFDRIHCASGTSRPAKSGRPRQPGTAGSGTANRRKHRAVLVRPTKPDDPHPGEHKGRVRSIELRPERANLGTRCEDGHG